MIKEEVVEIREDAEIGNIPSTSVARLETLVPQRKRRRSIEYIQASRPVRIRRTKSITTTEVARTRWEKIEAHIEFPILRPKTNATPQEPVVEEPHIERILFENGLLKEEMQAL